VVARSSMAGVATGGARLVTAAGVAIAVVAIVSSGLLLASATFDLDQIGARCQVFFAGAALLLAGRSYRHAGARAALRTAGLGGWAVLAAVMLSGSAPDRLATAAGVSIGLAVLLVVVAVAAGRGWRSAWWARRAEVAEGLSGALTLAALFVATGFCRTIWELTSRVDF
jgi:peptidoglycan/LPS O-acetylase OafA/YrhL